MDSLEFTVTREPDKLIISAKDRIGQTYRCIVTNYKTPQYPKVMLTDEAFADTVLEELSKCRYGYDQKANHVLASIPLIKNKLDARFILIPVPEEGEADYKTQLQELRIALDRLEPYEVIETHTYPQWDTLDEFKRLPDFKYFDAAENWRSYLKPLNGFMFFKTGQMFVQFRERAADNGYLEYSTNRILTPDIGGKWITEIRDDPNYERLKGVHKFDIRAQVIDGSKGVSYYIKEYIREYMMGWCILNLHMIIAADPYFEVHIDKSRSLIRIIIKRLKTMKWNLSRMTQVGEGQIIYTMSSLKMKAMFINGSKFINEPEFAD
jgi:hypothetical protein